MINKQTQRIKDPYTDQLKNGGKRFLSQRNSMCKIPVGKSLAHIRPGNNVSGATVSKEENGLERDPRGRQGWGDQTESMLTPRSDLKINKFILKFFFTYK